MTCRKNNCSSWFFYTSLFHSWQTVPWITQFRAKVAPFFLASTVHTTISSFRKEW